MVFGYITLTGKGELWEVTYRSSGSTIIGDYYADLMRQCVVPYVKAHVPSGIWQQDNASVHRTAAVWHELSAICHLGPAVWPPYSPDFSPIEGVWAVMTVQGRYEDLLAGPYYARGAFEVHL